MKRLITITQMGGTGKTTLAAKFAERISEQYDWNWKNCEDLTSKELFGAFIFFAKQLGYVELQRQFEELDADLGADDNQRSIVKIDMVIRFCASRASEAKKPLALFLDDFQLIADSYQHEINEIIRRLVNSQIPLKIVLISRVKPPRDLNESELHSYNIQVGPLSRDDCWKWVQQLAISLPNMQLTSDEFSLLMDRTEGIPQKVQIAIGLTKYYPFTQALELLSTSSDLLEWIKRLFNELKRKRYLQELAQHIAILRLPLHESKSFFFAQI